MTQFIVASGNCHTAHLPPGVGVRPLPNDSLASRVAAALFPDEICFQIFDLVSGEADQLFDDLHERLDTPADKAPGRSPVVVALEALAAEGCGVACWYADDYLELPCFDNWNDFINEVFQQARQMPPEVYAMIRPKGTVQILRLEPPV